MKKEILEKAKKLEKDIQQMEFALTYYKRGRWSCWEYANDRADTFHFEFCKDWSHRDADMQSLPTWLNKPLMEVVERELNRCKQELEALGDTDNGNVIQPESEYGEQDREGRQDKSQRLSLGSAFVRFCENMVGLLLYALLFCLLLGIANPTLSTREFVGYSLIFGFFAGLISNIERVMRELDKKKEGETSHE